MTDVLVGDVGGTSVRFAVADWVGGVCKINEFKKYDGDSFPDFETVLDQYLKDLGTAPATAFFALAGPPLGRSITLTNRPWTVDAPSLESRFGFERANLVNDFTAMARSVPEMPNDAFETIKPGEAVAGDPILVIGPGTGLGIATLFGGTSSGWHIIGGEGGHGAFAPRNDAEHALAKLIRRDHGYVSNERICAGVGLDSLHRAICERNNVAFIPLTPDDIMAKAGIGDELCLEICLVRLRTLLGVAGDLALANGTRGGVVLAGGVANKLSSFLSDESIIDRFVDRGIQRDYMSAIPIHLLTHEAAPLIGAASLYLDFQTRFELT